MGCHVVSHIIISTKLSVNNIYRMGRYILMLMIRAGGRIVYPGSSNIMSEVHFDIRTYW